eukprot:172428_1
MHMLPVFVLILNLLFLIGQGIELKAWNCMQDRLTVNDNLYITYDLALDSYMGFAYGWQHIFDIGSQYFFLRYEVSTKRYYFGIEGQRFFASQRTFSSPQDDGINVHHEIYITRNEFKWTMGNILVLHVSKTPHSSKTGQRVCFPAAGASVVPHGRISNFVTSSTVPVSQAPYCQRTVFDSSVFDPITVQNGNIITANSIPIWLYTRISMDIVVHSIPSSGQRANIFWCGQHSAESIPALFITDSGRLEVWWDTESQYITSYKLQPIHTPLRTQTTYAIQIDLAGYYMSLTLNSNLIQQMSRYPGMSAGTICWAGNREYSPAHATIRNLVIENLYDADKNGECHEQGAGNVTIVNDKNGYYIYSDLVMAFLLILNIIVVCRYSGYALVARKTHSYESDVDFK